MRDDEKKYWGLLSSLLAMLVVAPMVEYRVDASLIVGLIFGLLLIFAVWTVSHNTRTTLVATTLGLTLFAGNVADSWLVTNGFVKFVVMGAGCLFFAYVGGVIFRDTFYSHRVTLDTVLGAVCVYLMLGLCWGFAYGFVAQIDPTAFPSISADGHLLNRFVYFSFVTLTTLGFGDIVPTTAATRGLVMLEAIVGQIYLTVLVGRLIGLHLSHEQRMRPRHD
ncbi:MAG: potassium channel family protein [Pseudomonadota bacterium]